VVRLAEDSVLRDGTLQLDGRVRPRISLPGDCGHETRMFEGHSELLGGLDCRVVGESHGHNHRPHSCVLWIVAVHDEVHVARSIDSASPKPYVTKSVGLSSAVGRAVRADQAASVRVVWLAEDCIRWSRTSKLNRRIWPGRLLGDSCNKTGMLKDHGKHLSLVGNISRPASHRDGDSHGMRADVCDVVAVDDKVNGT